MKKILALTLIFSISIFLGGCTLLSNKETENSVVNTTLLSTPANNNTTPSPLVSKSPEDEINISNETDFDSLNSDLDKIDNLESVVVD